VLKRLEKMTLDMTEFSTKLSSSCQKNIKYTYQNRKNYENKLERMLNGQKSKKKLQEEKELREYELQIGLIREKEVSESRTLKPS